MPLKNITPLLGAHVPASGGLHTAFAHAQSIGSNCMQIFTKSNRQWHAKKLAANEIEAFAQAQQNFKITVIAHAAYIINLGSPNKETVHKSIQSLAQELSRCASLEIKYLVMHPGACLDSDRSLCIQQVGENLDVAIELADGPTMVLLENMAGQGSVIGKSFEELAAIRKHAKHKKKIGFCLDTCHAFASGYNFISEAGYVDMMIHLDNTLGIEHLKAIHFNDSEKPCGSLVDRHAQIGKGHLGLNTFSFFYE